MYVYFRSHFHFVASNKLQRWPLDNCAFIDKPQWGARSSIKKKRFVVKKQKKTVKKRVAQWPRKAATPTASATLAHMQPHDKVLTATRTHEYKLTCPNHIKLALNYAQKSKSKQQGDFPWQCCPPLRGGNVCPANRIYTHFITFRIRLRDVDFGQSVARFLSPAHDLW